MQDHRQIKALRQPQLSRKTVFLNDTHGRRAQMRLIKIQPDFTHRHQPGIAGAAGEFGIQPLLFTDAAGQALYCPYPLSVSIPAMMVGHLTLFGFAEVVFTTAVLAYLKKAAPELVRGDWTAASGFVATSALGDDVTTLFCANDQMALGALRALAEPYLKTEYGRYLLRVADGG